VKERVGKWVVTQSASVYILEASDSIDNQESRCCATETLAYEDG
jgi:hypothetical protein